MCGPAKWWWETEISVMSSKDLTVLPQQDFHIFVGGVWDLGMKSLKVVRSSVVCRNKDTTSRSSRASGIERNLILTILKRHGQYMISYVQQSGFVSLVQLIELRWFLLLRLRFASKKTKEFQNVTTLDCLSLKYLSQWLATLSLSYRGFTCQRMGELIDFISLSFPIFTLTIEGCHGDI